MELLKKLQFTEICLEDYSLAGQIALFNAAQAIVAPHGAGLTNLTFCEANTFVLEFMAEEHNEPFYENISRSRGLRYQSLRCTPTDASNLAISHLTVNLDSLRIALESL